MNFITTYQSGGRFLLIFFGGMVLGIPAAVILLYQMDAGALIAFAPIAITFGMLFLGLKLAYVKTTVKIDGDTLSVNQKELPFSEIKSYFLRKPTPRVTALDLCLKSGDEITITGLNYGRVGEPMNHLIAAMRERFESANPPIELAESEASRKIKRYRRRWRVAIKATIAFALLCDLFMLVMLVTGHASLRHLAPLLAPNLMIPYLLSAMGKLE
ncbi:MAG TPA: hypothetical protein VNW52_00235 [Burkholderiaceae bacterium]|jgi:hypothetical protein|nr:hypothetical protein [Burkholderiaceae bacterium]